MAIKRIPWWLRIAAKIVLFRLPVPYSVWQKIGLFRHGETNLPRRAIDTFDKYYQKAVERGMSTKGFTSLELGPGDSVLTGFVARAYGAQRVYLLDAGRFAAADMNGYKTLYRELQKAPIALSSPESTESLEDLLTANSVTYLTNGIRSLSEIPAGSVDFFWSQVVLEHIPEAEFFDFFVGLRRVLKDGAIGVHSIDFRDHLGGGLNNLRFSKKLWEKNWFSRSGFYTNRLRPRQMLELLGLAGFQVEVLSELRWDQMPIRRRDLASEFRSLEDSDFLIAELDILLRPKGPERDG
ncbi:MAG TPA: methyltransferase [Leptospiraceae bacterium]|nr:methyltransferase [Spirochaetaceae bacterium]HBS04629.1 methyltransferase [Leptospiraceae bacterium]|tara:strand:- start:12244 stop:13128 length:885 start_codon:yes stop_codon:yes gene_type:complete